MKNERGSTLILVLLISTVFITIGLAIFTVTINGTKRAEIRKTDVATTQSAIGEMNAILSDFKQEVTKLPIAELSTLEYDSKLADIIQKLELKYTGAISRNAVLSVADQTESALHLKNYKDYFTRYYEVALIYVNDVNNAEPKITKTIKRNVLLSPTPSFLQYAAGSENTLQLNGASEIIGNVYGDTITLANKTRYANMLTNAAGSIATQFTYQDTLYPSIQGNLIINKQLEIYDRQLKQADSNPQPASGKLNEALRFSGAIRIDKQHLAAIDYADFTGYFYEKNGTPFIHKAHGRFSSVDFKETFADKLNKLGFLNIKKEDIPDANNKNGHEKIVQAILNGKSNVKVISTTADLSASAAEKVLFIKRQAATGTTTEKNAPAPEAPSTLGHLIEKDAFVISDNVELRNDSSQWLIVDGDLAIYSNQKPISIIGNILVLGNVFIYGNPADFGHETDSVSFDSTIYATGKATIYSTNIKGENNGQLVLLSQDDLLITRINEFQNAAGDIEPLEAYLYTDKNAELYGIGSLFKIYGGIFAKRELTINAIRQNEMNVPEQLPDATKIDLPIVSSSLQEGQHSRFVVEHNKDILLNQLDALPAVNTLQFIVEDYQIEAGKKSM
ncbi:MAG: hypothetical protein ACE3JP_03080 [Ectobacillus sp.]